MAIEIISHFKGLTSSFFLHSMQLYSVMQLTLKSHWYCLAANLSFGPTKLRGLTFPSSKELASTPYVKLIRNFRKAHHY